MHATHTVDCSRGPVLAALRGATPRSPADLALVERKLFQMPTFVWIAAGKLAPVPNREVQAWAPLEAFDVRVFVRAERRELVIWRAGPGRPDCKWVHGPVADELRVADAVWDDTIAALARQTGPIVAGAAL